MQKYECNVKLVLSVNIFFKIEEAVNQSFQG